MTQSNNCSEESTKANVELTKKSYEHPYFTHDEHGNIDWAYKDFYNLRKSPAKISLTVPLTEDDIENNIMSALEWCEGNPQHLEAFLYPQLYSYQSRITWNESEQPFFDFLIQLMRQPKYKTRKNIYDSVLLWIKDRSPIKPSNENPVEVISSSKTTKLDIREVAILYVLTGKKITSGTIAKRIAKEYGYESVSSDRQLMDDYNKYGFLSKSNFVNDIELTHGEARWIVKNLKNIKQLLATAKQQDLVDKAIAAIEEKFCH